MEQGELIKIISKVMEKERATSVRELAENLWESPDCNTSAKSLEIFKKVVKKSLEIMYARGKITKLRFKVPTGCGYTFVYGLSQEDCWNYCFKKGYAPEKLIRTLSYLLGSQGFVTNLELQELGFSFKIIKRWVEKKLIKEGNYLKVHEVLKNLKVYYLPHLEGQLDAYLRSDHFKQVYEKYCERIRPVHGIGKIFEDIVAEIYKRKGYKVIKQFPILELRHEPGKEDRKVYFAYRLDLLAFKPIEEGNSPNDLIIVECKNRQKPISIGLIWHLIPIRNNHFKGRGEIHVYAFNGATRSVWSAIKEFPYLRIINKRKFYEELRKLGLEEKWKKAVAQVWKGDYGEV